MSWTDRLREAAYTSPSGTRYTFDFQDVSRSTDRKTSAFEYPDGDGTYVQDLGSTGRRYPIVAIFWGEDYDIEATAFEAALNERGAALLTHPMYGQVDVVPFGTIERADRLKSGANQATVTVVLYETTGVVYPDALTNPADAVLGSVSAFNDAGAADFAAGLNVASVAEGVTLANQWTAFVDEIDTFMGNVAAVQADVLSEYEAIEASINNSIDVLIRKPLTLAMQAQRLAQLPSQIVDGAKARLDAYADLARSLTSSEPQSPGLDNVVLNLFKSGEVNAMAAVAAQALSVVSSKFETQADAINAADTILVTFAEVTAWRDANYPLLGIIDTGDSYQLLQESVALAAGFAVQLSFSLKREQTLTLDRPRSIIELVAELYGSVDDQLDFFINSNVLTGDEILEIPAGRTVVFYV
jgi:prophage DNA circulation protein